MPVGRRQVQQCQLPVAASIQEARHRIDHHLSAQHQRRARREAGKNFFGGGVETHRRELQHPVARVDTRDLRDRPHIVGDRSVLDHHPLGLAGRTGGVNHIRQILRSVRAFDGIVRETGDLVPFGIETNRVGVRRRQPGELILLRHQHPDLAISQHVFQAVGRIVGIQGQVGPTRFENAEHADDQVERSFQAETDDHTGRDTPPAEVMGHTVRARIQLPIGQFLVALSNRDRIRGAQHLCFDLAMEALCRRLQFRRLSPRQDCLATLRLGHERQ